MMPFKSVLAAAVKLIVASVKHPNTDKEIVVLDDSSVEVVLADQPRQRPAAAH